MNIINFSSTKDVVSRNCGIVLFLRDQYSWIAKIRPDYGDTISKVKSLFHFTLTTFILLLRILCDVNLWGKDDRPNPQTSITLEQVSIWKVLTSLEPRIPALCAHRSFIKQINDLLILTEFINKDWILK